MSNKPKFIHRELMLLLAVFVSIALGVAGGIGYANFVRDLNHSFEHELALNCMGKNVSSVTRILGDPGQHVEPNNLKNALEGSGADIPASPAGADSVYLYTVSRGVVCIYTKRNIIIGSERLFY